MKIFKSFCIRKPKHVEAEVTAWYVAPQKQEITIIARDKEMSKSHMEMTFQVAEAERLIAILQAGVDAAKGGVKKESLVPKG